MSTCKDCIHFKICNDYEYLIGRETKVACPDYKSTEDVIPKNEVEKLQKELAEANKDNELLRNINDSLAVFLEKAEEEVVREIITELKVIWKDSHGFIDCRDLHEFEKKYIGESNE